MTASAARPAAGSSRFAHLDALRALAVLLVVLAHAGLGHVVPGGVGVTIFFSISGFIITWLLLRERAATGSFSARLFFARRALKILPPFAVVIALPSAVYALAGGRVDGSTALAQLLFVYNWARTGLDAGGDILAGTGVVWSLAIEEQFYVVLAAFWLLAHRARRHVAVLTATALAATAYSLAAKVVLALQADTANRIYYGSDTRTDGLALGILAAVLHHRLTSDATSLPRVRRALGHDATLLFAGALLVVSIVVRDPLFRDTLRFTFQSVATCLVILYGLSDGRGPCRRLLDTVAAARGVRVVGQASYSIYLVHLVLISAAAGLLTGLPRPVSTAVLVVLTTGAGTALWRLLEVPLDPVRARLRPVPHGAADRTAPAVPVPARAGTGATAAAGSPGAGTHPRVITLPDSGSVRPGARQSR
ncbi:acyltransferase [Kineococcus gypseus]|uniref:acyltransferase family protein n=1 Tax=Kineococcus gypseus TaxID=1637102 RepID=UPI003D7C9BD4